MTERLKIILMICIASVLCVTAIVSCTVITNRNQADVMRACMANPNAIKCEMGADSSGDKP